ncbi:hypothetical protein ACX3VG_17080, partial [Escherichia coli]
SSSAASDVYKRQDIDKRIIRFHKVLLVNKDNIDSLY